MILQDVSTNGKYIGFTMMIWVIPMSTITLIILPKVFSFYRQTNAGSVDSQRAASTHQSGVQVSSVNVPNTNSSSQAAAVSGISHGNSFDSYDDEKTATEHAAKDSTEPK